MDKTSVSKATFSRLPDYLEILKRLPPQEVPFISSAAIAGKLSLGEVQVRKDLASVCGAGKPRLGYPTEELIENIEEALGYNHMTPAVLVGAGRLGKALLQSDEFERYGIKITAAFDVTEQKNRIGCVNEILSIKQFDEFCRNNNIHLGIITTSEDAAQEICNQMVESGIMAIWNFAPRRLKVPKGVILQNENLALSLAHLISQLCEANQKNTDIDKNIQKGDARNET